MLVPCTGIGSSVIHIGAEPDTLMIGKVYVGREFFNTEIGGWPHAVAGRAGSGMAGSTILAATAVLFLRAGAYAAYPTSDGGLF